ncbi:hypothetical protein [Limnoglobus roseus]|uniref:Uncharacterized protein n=1 Tax=Limnoglobus roseus TaxID=2598579 RepID=A0A5C1ACP8_9BACT|nr:hypothetical protein [Limnoglobus roseus]QEL14818.1 hypothetical protein PX52LOC_01716 [Limnoglobus roseus]
MGDDFLIRAAIEWAKVAARLRVASTGDDCPLRAATLRLPREVAWCHLLFAAGRPEAVMVRLRGVMREARQCADLPVTGDVFSDATAILACLRRAVQCRFSV